MASEECAVGHFLDGTVQCANGQLIINTNGITINGQDCCTRGASEKLFKQEVYYCQLRMYHQRLYHEWKCTCNTGIQSITALSHASHSATAVERFGNMYMYSYLLHIEKAERC